MNTPSNTIINDGDKMTADFIADMNKKSDGMFSKVMHKEMNELMQYLRTVESRHIEQGISAKADDSLLDDFIFDACKLMIKYRYMVSFKVAGDSSYAASDANVLLAFMPIFLGVWGASTHFIEAVAANEASLDRSGVPKNHPVRDMYRVQAMSSNISYFLSHTEDFGKSYDGACNSTMHEYVANEIKKHE